MPVAAAVLHRRADSDPGRTCTDLVPAHLHDPQLEVLHLEAEVEAEEAAVDTAADQTAHTLRGHVQGRLHQDDVEVEEVEAAADEVAEAAEVVAAAAGSTTLTIDDVAAAAALTTPVAEAAHEAPVVAIGNE